MAASALLISLVLVLASSSASAFSGVFHSNNGKLKHLQLYMYAVGGVGANATALQAVTSGVRANTTFGQVTLLDNELRDGPVPSNSSLIGRVQGIVVYLGLVTPPGMETVLSFVFTGGEHAGSTLAVIGSLINIDGAFERPVVGGTGNFRMTRGYSNLTTLNKPTADSTVFEFNIFLKIDA